TSPSPTSSPDALKTKCRTAVVPPSDRPQHQSNARRPATCPPPAGTSILTLMAMPARRRTVTILVTIRQAVCQIGRDRDREERDRNCARRPQASAYADRSSRHGRCYSPTRLERTKSLARTPPPERRLLSGGARKLERRSAWQQSNWHTRTK